MLHKDNLKIYKVRILTKVVASGSLAHPIVIRKAHEISFITFIYDIKYVLDFFYLEITPFLKNKKVL